MQILPLPVRFDANEWYVIISSLLFFIVAWISPKRFPAIITISICLFTVTLAKIADYFLSAGTPYDLYDYSDTKKLDLFDQLLHYILYPIVGYLQMYVYDIWISKKYNRMIFLFLSVTISLMLEWTALQAHVYHYKGWKFVYSIPSYFVLMTLTIAFYHLLKKWILYRKNW